MLPLKKSLRARFTLVLLLVGVLPLAGAAVFFYLTPRDALFRNVFKELKWNVDEIAATIEGRFSRTSKDLLLASTISPSRCISSTPQTNGAGSMSSTSPS